MNSKKDGSLGPEHIYLKVNESRHRVTCEKDQVLDMGSIPGSSLLYVHI